MSVSTSMIVPQSDRVVNAPALRAIEESLTAHVRTSVGWLQADGELPAGEALIDAIVEEAAAAEEGGQPAFSADQLVALEALARRIYPSVLVRTKPGRGFHQPGGQTNGRRNPA